MGLLALGYGFIYQQRRHTIDVRDTEEVHELNTWIEEAEVTPVTTGLLAKVETSEVGEIVEGITDVEEVIEKVETIAKAIPVPKPVKGELL